MEPLVQPFPHPLLFQEPGRVGLGVGQGEFLAGLHVQRAGREIGPAFAGRQQLRVEGQGEAVGMALGIRRGQFHQPRPRPVSRPLIEQMIAVWTRLPDAQKWQRNPDAVENAGSLGGVQRIDLLRLNRPPVPGYELAAGVIGVQCGQNGATVGASFRQEGPRDPRFVEIEPKIQKLDRGVRNQVDERTELFEFRQHLSHLRASLAVGSIRLILPLIFDPAPENGVRPKPVLLSAAGCPATSQFRFSGDPSVMR